MEQLFTPVKQKNKQAKRKKKLQWNIILRRLILILTVAIVTLSLWWLYQITKPAVAPLSKVKVTATFQHLERYKLQQVIAPFLANGFFYLNVIGLKHQLLNLPWIKTVAIQREWPDTIVISIVEQKPVARWGNKALFTADGKIFYPDPATFPQNIPLLLGTDDQAANVFQQYRQMQLQLFPAQLFILQIFLSPQHYWHLALNTGTQLLLSEKNASQELALLLTLYPKIMQGHDKPPLSIDLRYSNGMAVKWNTQEPEIKNPEIKKE